MSVRYPDQPLEKSNITPEVRARLNGFYWLARIADGFREASDELSHAIGVPLCVEGCGLCCIGNTPMAFGIEVHRAADWLLEQSADVRNRILDRIEDWLLKPVLELEYPRPVELTVKHPRMGKNLLNRTIVDGDEVLVMQKGRCPLLGDDLRCTVYEVRPIGCRAFGVTTQPPKWCQRPEGQGEDDEHRAVFAGSGTARLRAVLRKLVEATKDHPRLANAYVFPTALYARFREERLIAMLDQIPTARLVGGRNAFRPHVFDEPLEAPIEVKDGEIRVKVGHD